MPDKRTHRGAHPVDVKQFAAEKVELLRRAVEDFSLLLSKGYAEKSALKLVGDHFSLTRRQRLGVLRSSCSDEQLRRRRERQVPIEALAGEELIVDGYNILITVEAALSGGLILEGRDGCYRDLASIHGTYRKVTETIGAIELIAEVLEEVGAGAVRWLLDRPVSNSGRLRSLIGKLAEEHRWRWEVELVISPDAVMLRSDQPIASSDSVVLDGCQRWVNLATEVIRRKVQSAWVIKLGGCGED